MTEPDWVEQMLREALKSDNPLSDFTDFEVEYRAITTGMLQREGRAIICAAASLAAATSSLRIASNLPPLPEHNDVFDTLDTVMRMLVAVLPRDYLTFLPATMAAYLIRKDGSDGPPDR